MLRGVAVGASRAALIVLLGLGVASVAPSWAQQPESNMTAAAVAAPSGPVVRYEMPRAEARFRDSEAPRFTDHTTTVRISTIVLILAIVILVLVLI